MRTRTLVLLCSGGALAIAVVMVLVASLMRPTEPPTAPVVSTTAPTPTPTSRYNPTAGDAAPSDEDQDDLPAGVQEKVWGPVVDNFARNFTNTGGGPGPWRQRLIGNPARPNVTAAVSAELHSVDVRNVPAGHYTGHRVLRSSAYELGIKVTYREGWAMILSLNTDGSKWEIYAYDKLEP